MKKAICLIMVVGITLMLFGCNGKMSGMPKYETKECYYGEGFQDYTDYYKYFYNESVLIGYQSGSVILKQLEKQVGKLLLSAFELVTIGN